MVRVIINGACGRMGRLIIQSVAQQDDMELVGAIEYPDTHKSGVMLALSQVSARLA